MTNAQSKSRNRHVATQAVFFAFFNFCRKHDALNGKTPAMASELTDKVCSVQKLLKEAA